MTSDEKDAIIRLGIDSGIIIPEQSGYFVPDILTVTTKNPEVIEQKTLDHIENNDTDFDNAPDRAVLLLKRFARRISKESSQEE